MVKYHLHENGWTVIIDDFNFKTATQQDAEEIAYLLSTHIAVVAKNSDKIKSLEPKDEVNFCSMIGNIFEYDREIGNAINLSSDEDGRKIQRVTATLNEHGHPGLFGQDDELDWHCNKPWEITRKSFVFLRSAKSAKNSRTSVTNTNLAYEDMKKEFPDFIAELEEKQYKVVCGWRKDGGHTVFYDYWEALSAIETSNFKSYETSYPLIMTNESGKKGFFLPFLQCHEFLGYTEEFSRPIMKRIWDYCLQSKYVYDHDWGDEDEVLMMEQWLSVHKRWAYHHNPERLLHRLEFDFDNCSWFQDRKADFKKSISDNLKSNIKVVKKLGLR